MTSSIRFTRVLVSIVFFTLSAHSSTAQDAQILSPEEYFGFEMGADRQLARWDKLVEYYELLGEQSSRLIVVNSGPSTMGNPFLILFISSPDNLARLDELKQINAILSDPRGYSDLEIEGAIANGRAVVVQSMGLHSSEVASSQMAAELTYDMLTRTDEELMRILDNTIAIMIPCFNPDGEIMVTDWYYENVGTAYEGVSLPWLYHKYIGHDNNRDAFQTNTIESVYGAQLMFREWVPQAYIDHHQMGAYGARLYVPPYAEPIRPAGDPLVWREMSWYGAHIAYKEEEAGIAGVVNAAVYSGWGHFGFHWITPFHNIAGMLTESASARLATPLFVHPDQLSGSRRGLPEYEAQTTFPNPWEGGWWRVRDIVVQQKIAAIAALDMAARNRETVLRNAYLKAKRQTERGANGETAAFIIPAVQHDPLTMAKMINKLLGQGIEIHQSTSAFTHEGKVYGEGSFVVSMAQPKMGLIRWLLGRTLYPDNTYTRARDGSPIRPYDMSTDNMSEFMGVRVDAVETRVNTEMTIVGSELMALGRVSKGQVGYVLDGRLNDSFRAVNQLIEGGVDVFRAMQAVDGVLRPGDFVVMADASDALVANVARETGVDFGALDSDVTTSTYPVRRRRIGMYQRYYGGNMDEGWTRLLLERFEFPYSSIMDAELISGDLNKKYDVIILPADGADRMTGDTDEPTVYGTGPEAYPEQYRSGFGEEGVDALKAFVEEGGVLLTFAQAGELAIDEFKLPVRRVVDGLPSTEFWSPGSTLRIDVDNTNPLAYGMPEKALAAFLGGNDAYQVVPSSYNDHVERIVTFVDRDILQSGWLIGEKVISKKAAMVSVERGKGKIILIGFRAQHRMQTHGTFKLVFNALLTGPVE